MVLSKPKYRNWVEPEPTAWEESMYTLRVLLPSIATKIVNAFGLSLKWSKWGIDRLKMNLYHLEEGVLSFFDESALSTGATLGGYSLNKDGVVYKNLKEPYRCSNVLSWSDIGKYGIGEFILRDSIEAACKCLLQYVELKKDSSYGLWVTQYELCLDSACKTRANQHHLYNSIKELLTESLKDLYPVVIEKEYTEPYVQFQKLSGRVVEIVKLYCKSQARGGSILRFEYAWDCGGGNQPPTRSLYLPLETCYKGRKIVLRSYRVRKSLEDELLDTIVSEGVKGLERVIKRVVGHLDGQRDRAS